MPKILIIYSKIHELHIKQKDLCVQALLEKGYSDIETLGTNAGSKELPQIVSIVHQRHYSLAKQSIGTTPPDAYIVLGLVNTDNKAHARSIKKEVIPFFRKLKMEDHLIIGDGILYASPKEFSDLLISKNPCENMYASAVNAVHELLTIKNSLTVPSQPEKTTKSSSLFKSGGTMVG